MLVNELRQFLADKDGALEVLVEGYDHSYLRIMAAKAAPVEVDNRTQPPAFYELPQSIEGSWVQDAVLLLL